MNKCWFLLSYTAWEYSLNMRAISTNKSLLIKLPPVVTLRSVGDNSIFNLDHYRRQFKIAGDILNWIAATFLNRENISGVRRVDCM